MKIECIFWDFDGVILDSMPVRDLGFESVLKHFPEEKTLQLLAYHRKNGGLSRYHKFRYFFEEILQIPVQENTINEYAASFSIIMKDLLTDKSRLIRDAVDFIIENYDKYEFHIVSGSDEEELKYLCKQLEIDRYFKTINGSPTPKKEIVHKLLNQLNYQKKDVCLIGDSVNDYEAAKVNNIAFFGYNNSTLKDLGNGYLESFSKQKVF